MAFLLRIGKSKLSQSSHQFKSFPRGSLLNPTVSHAEPCHAENLYRAIPNNKHTGFCNNVRFFAASFQFQKASKEEKDSSRHRMNEEITAEVLRVVIDKEHSVISRSEALLRAKQLNLDLVEVDPKASPPVCKLVDYNRDKYENDLKGKERVKTKAEGLRANPKEVRLSMKTEQRDLQMKASNLLRLMEDGYRVKCTVKGSVQAGSLETLTRLCALIEDVALIESGPTLGKDCAYLVVRHIKFQKKGGMKKLKDLTDESSGLLVARDTTASDEETGFEKNEDSFLCEVNQDRSSSLASASSNADTHCSQKPSFERYSAGPNAATSPRAEASSEAGNRYSQKGGAKNQFSPTKEMGHMNQFSNQGRQPPRESRFPPGTGESREVPTNGPAFRNHRPPPNDVLTREPYSPNAPSTPRPGHGQFSGSRDNNYTPGRHGVEAGLGEEKEQNRYATRRPEAARGSPAANQKPDGSQPSYGRTRQGGFGVFSR